MNSILNTFGMMREEVIEIMSLSIFQGDTPFSERTGYLSLAGFSGKGLNGKRFFLKKLKYQHMQCYSVLMETRGCNHAWI